MGPSSLAKLRGNLKLSNYFIQYKQKFAKHESLFSTIISNQQPLLSSFPRSLLNTKTEPQLSSPQNQT